MANARMRLKELADRIPNARVERAVFSTNGGIHPPFEAYVRVYDAQDVLRFSGSSQGAHKKTDAEEAAATAALRDGDLGAPDANLALPTAVRAQAWLGDAALEVILALLATRSGLSAAQMDNLSQRLLCNNSLAAGAPEQLASAALTATEVEARLGRRLAQIHDELLDLLLPALEEANPTLAETLQDAVAAH